MRDQTAKELFEKRKELMAKNLIPVIASLNMGDSPKDAFRNVL